MKISNESKMILMEIFLDLGQYFWNVCKKIDFYKNNILQHSFSKSVHGSLTVK
jgi:hypothetical protein